MGTVGVLCTRVRVEEKQVMAALAEAGLRPEPLQPAGLPLPPFPSPSLTPTLPAAAMAGGLAGGVVLDRCHKRAVAAAVLSALRAHDVEVFDAGLAARGDRLAVATALARAGVPRPWTSLATTQESALAAVAQAGYPATLLPLPWDNAPVALLDEDAAEAVIEHRAVLGAGAESLAIVQQGTAHGAATVTVVGNEAIAVEGFASDEAIAVAEAAARALGADLIGVVVAETSAGPVAWDVLPAPDFRHARPLGGRSVADAIADLITGRFATRVGGSRPSVEIGAGIRVEAAYAGQGRRDYASVGVGGEVRDGVVLTA
jgi:hypothetical protein